MKFFYIYIAAAVLYFAVSGRILRIMARETLDVWQEWGRKYESRSRPGKLTRRLPLVIVMLILYGIRPVAFVALVFLGLVTAPYHGIFGFFQEGRRKRRFRKEEKRTLKLACNYVNGVLAVSTNNVYWETLSRRNEAIRAGYSDYANRLHVDPVCLFYEENKHKISDEDLKMFFVGSTDDFERRCQEYARGGLKVQRVHYDNIYVPFASPSERKRDIERCNFTKDTLFLFGV